MPRITEGSIQEVIDRVDLVDLISGYVRLHRAGSRFKGLCPFHQEKTPSFVVSPDRGIWHCFGCNKGGNGIKFVELTENLSFPDAIKFLAEKYRINLRFERGGGQFDAEENPYEATEFAADFFSRCLTQTPADHPARQFIAQRRISEEAVKQFRLGYAPSGWDGLLKAARQAGISVEKLEKAGLVLPRKSGDGHYDRFRHRFMFPIATTTGKVIAFGGRDLGEDGPKYINSPETPLFSKSHTLYGMNLAREALRERKAALLCEGYMDALALHLAGFTHAVATLGTAMTDDHTRILSRYVDEVFLVFDADAAGQQAAIRAIEILLRGGLSGRIVRVQEGKDPDELIRARGPEAFQEALEAAVDCVDFRIRRALEDHGGKTPAEKTRVAREILPLINLVRSEVERTAYLERLAAAIGVPLDVVQKESRRLQRQELRRAAARSASAEGSPEEGEEEGEESGEGVFTDPDELNFSVALNSLIRIYLEVESEIQGEIRSELSRILPLDENPRYDRLIRLLLSGDLAVDGTTLSGQLDRIDADIQQLLTRILCSDPAPANKELAIRQCLESIETIRNKRRLQAELARVSQVDNGASEIHSYLEGVMDVVRKRQETSFHANEPM